MADIKREFALAEAEKFKERNGIVMRMMATAFRRGWFGIKDVVQTLAAYDMGLDEILESIDYFEDRRYIECRDSETKCAVRSADCEPTEMEIRLTADGKLLGYSIISDEGIDI